MNNINRDIFRAIHEGKWLSIEYKNHLEEVTKYWIEIKNISVTKRKLNVNGLHLGKYSMMDAWICIDSILSSSLIEGTYSPVNSRLVEDIYLNPDKYKGIFDNVANLKILNYYEMCNRYDVTPYYTEFSLVQYLDNDKLKNGDYTLSDEQFAYIIKYFQRRAEKQQSSSQTHLAQSQNRKINIRQLGINVLSLYTPKGLYVLAYRKLNLDVKARMLRPSEEITVCTEFSIDGVKETVRKYLDADDYELLEDFESNQEKIKDCLTRNDRWHAKVDDMPYIIGMGMDVLIDLHREYQGIIDMFESDKVTVPMKAFFGDLLERPIRRKEYPITLLNENINMDQLLAINNAMKYPLAYVQGPPGTGKTSTILNTILTAFFNERTVLFASYNNHPINGVVDKLANLKYNGRTIPFPILRLGNVEKIKETLSSVRNLYQQCQALTIYENTLDKNKGERTQRAKKLGNLLKQYEETLDLKERKETLHCLIDYEGKNLSFEMLPFATDLQNRQLAKVNDELAKIGDINDEDALTLLDRNFEELYKYLYFTSAKYIKKIDESKNKEFKSILFEGDEETRLDLFIKYISKSENVKKLQKIFPIMATTCLSANKIGEPEPLFDMVIIDEASQCNTAVSMVPVIRGETLMLVGDPQQLNPVILLADNVNTKLRKYYHVSDEYDYKKNSIYKTFLMCDAVSDEVLLHHHYRCNPKIIEFNNKKYYNSKLKIDSKNQENHPLTFVDVKNYKKSDKRNESLAEAETIIHYAKENRDKSIGIITPFVNQRKLIESELERNQLSNVVCGTVHAFQGDEKDIVLFSTAITEDTNGSTYEWLKNNKELLNVATSRAKDRLILLADYDSVKKLHFGKEDDDLFELVEYVKNKGTSVVTQKTNQSRALGIKPFSSETESAFLQNLNHALQNIWLSQSKYKVYKEVAVSQVFQDNITYSDLFYTGRFDFVVYERQGEVEIPILAIELDGKEHFEDEIVRNRDAKKNKICEEHNLQLIRVENSYARRYHHIKEILMRYFSVSH